MNALIVMAHGSRHEPANDEVRGLAAQLADQGFADRVAAAFLEAQPDLPATIAAQVAAGARAIIVLPLFLNTGNHVRRDIPRLIAEARASHPGIQIDQLEHIGASDLYADFIARIAGAALAKP